MKFAIRVAVFAALLAVVDCVIYYVLTSNLCNGVYPVNADSLGIPFMETIMLSLVAAALLLVAALVSGIDWLFRQAKASAVWRCLLAVSLSLTHLSAAALFALWGFSWAEPHHYFIVAVCGLAALLVLYFLAAEIRLLRPNNSFKPNSLRGSA
jgi:hypothetical protein